MKITLKSDRAFKEYLSQEKSELLIGLELPDNTKVEDLLDNLRIPRNIPRVILINGTIKGEKDLLKDNDVVCIFSPVGGG